LCDWYDNTRYHIVYDFEQHTFVHRPRRGGGIAFDRHEQKVKNYYLILEVSSTASVDVIKASGRALSARYHPDKKETADVKKYHAVREALEVLLDPVKRAAHDYALANPRARAEQQYQEAQHPMNGQTGRMAWQNGAGFVFVPDEAGPFPSDRPYPNPASAYPMAYPDEMERQAKEAARDLAHDIVDQLLNNMLNRGRRR
jgi:DnaJ-class molecular chaperone